MSANPPRSSTPLATYRLGRAALDLGTFTVGELAALAEVPVNTIYGFIARLRGKQLVTSEPLSSPRPGRPAEQYSLTEEGMRHLFDQHRQVARLLRAEKAAEPPQRAEPGALLSVLSEHAAASAAAKAEEADEIFFDFGDEEIRTLPDPQSEPSPDAFHVAAGVRIGGEVRSDVDVVVDGSVGGPIVAHADVHIRQDGLVHDVAGRVVVVEGKVDGNVVAAERAELGPTATVVGDVRSPDIQVAAGSHVEGTIVKTTHAAAAWPAG